MHVPGAMCTHLAIEFGMPPRTRAPAEVTIAIGYMRCSTDEQTLSPSVHRWPQDRRPLEQNIYRNILLQEASKSSIRA